MAWDERVGSIHYYGIGGVVNIDAPPSIGELADLTQGGHEFRVEITNITDESISGRVQVIGPAPTLEACGIRRGQIVSFSESNIQELHRQGGA